jgi:hypothetical protein
MRYIFHLLYSMPTVALAADQTATPSGKFDWDLVLKALGFVVAAVAAYVQIRDLRLTSRTSLKTDLEILKLLDSNDSTYNTVKTAVDGRIARLYAPKPGNTSTRWFLAIGGLLWALGFSYWTFKLVQPGFTWWALLTGYLALTGVWPLYWVVRSHGVGPLK